MLLAIETSTSALSAALFKDGQLLEEVFELPASAKHTERLLPIIDALIGRHHCDLKKIEAMALSIGPGSYTSLRVGLATIMGFIADRSVRVHAVSTLLSMAFGMKGHAEFVAPILKAGRGLLMGGIFKSSDLSCIFAEGPYTQEVFLREIKSRTPSIAMGGTGFDILAPHLDNATNILAWPRASHLGHYVLTSNLPSVSIQDVKLNYFLEALG